MKKFMFFCLLAVAFCFSSCGGGEGGTKVLISTNLGDIKILLYDQTPMHRDNFIKLAKEGLYDGTLFHRVIPTFMIQGGDPSSKGSPAGAPLGNGGPGYTIPAEIGLHHFRGALSAARLGDRANPKKESSGSQFFIVTGIDVTDQMLEGMERSKGIKYSDAQKQLYKEVGGRPDLDAGYTVYGEVTEGMDVVDKISQMPANGSNRPNEDVTMTVKVL